MNFYMILLCQNINILLCFVSFHILQAL